MGGLLGCLCCSSGVQEQPDSKPPLGAMISSPFEAQARSPPDPAVPSSQDEVFSNPILALSLTDAEVARIRTELSEASEPMILSRPQVARVNTSIFGEGRGRSTTLKDFQRLDSTLPKHGAQFLSWTQSRKLLEAAIAAEQQSIPEDGQAAGPPADEWEAIARAEGRLLDRLHKFRLDMFVMEGDGNCQFRSVSFGLYGRPDYHGYVRQKAIQHMQAHADEYAVFLGEDVQVYLREMAKDGVWGDELTLRAICDAFGVVMNVITDDEANWFMRYLPANQTAVQHEVFLTYIAPIHYNAVRRQVGSSFDRTGSFSRKHSQILRAVSEYAGRRVLPDNPGRVAQLAGSRGRSC